MNNILLFYSLIISGVKMKANLLISIVIIVISASLLNCTSPNDSSEPSFDQSESYIPLYKGIEKDYTIVEDSAQILTEIVGNVIREDGQKLFIIEEKHIRYKAGDEIDYHAYYRYNYVKDGFLYETNIIKQEDKSNPFSEIVFEKADPKNGEKWTLNPNKISETNYEVKAEYIGDMETPAGVFQDVYCFQFIDSMNFEYPDTFKSYNAKGIGNIARNMSGTKMVVNYVKTKDAEYGERFFWH